MPQSGFPPDRNGAAIQMQSIVYWKGKRARVIGMAYDYKHTTLHIEMINAQQRPRRRRVAPEEVEVETL